MSGITEFRVVSRSKTENVKGVKYKVRLKSGEGHTLTLVSTSEEIFAGYPIEEKIPVNIQRRFKTLQEVEGEV